MSQLPTRDDLLRRKSDQRDEIARPHQRAQSAERQIQAARAQYWELLQEFVTRAQELDVRPQICDSESHDGRTPRITWVEGYPLSSGAVVSVPPLRYCLAERRRVLRPVLEECNIDELSLFLVPGGYDALGLPLGPVEQQTATRNWPRMDRLEETGITLTALRRQLEASLLALMD
jgi:hypothetical protein